jgi:threonine dehydratase
MKRLPVLADVEAAAERIAGVVCETPLIETRIRGHRVWLKCESLQEGGAFKLRGASNRLLRMTPAERARGVVAFSSGNHAQGVAIAAERLGMPALIVMPADAPALKVEGTRRHGAEIVFYDRRTESREAIAERIAAERGSIVVPSFDDADVIAGQGTAGLEVARQLGRQPNLMVTPCGGGGLASGLALASPSARIAIAEPAGWDDMRRSLALGRIEPVQADAPSTLCDALQTPRVSPMTFAILQARKVEAHAVSEGEVADAVRWAFKTHELTVEPGGAAGLALLLAGTIEPEGETVVMLSGGNIDPALHARLVAET